MVGVKIMKHYKSTTNEVWAFEEDGSQDHLIPNDFILISDDEADELNRIKILRELGEPLPAPTKEELMAKLLEIQKQLEQI
jgi:hypothetical protein